jgi:hypothetical protein
MTLVYESFLAGKLSSRYLFHLTLMVARAHNATFVAPSVSNTLNSPKTYHSKTPPRRSARSLAHAQPSNKDSTTSRPKRGSHGFHKFKNGLLNLTPVSDDEKAL